MRSDELERRLQGRLDALGRAPRAELLHVLILAVAEWLPESLRESSPCLDSSTGGKAEQRRRSYSLRKWPIGRFTDKPNQPTLSRSDKEVLVRRGVLAFAVTFVLALSGIAAASVFAGAGDDKGEGNEQDAGVHGGPIDRFHQAGSCDLAAVSSLPGNWTHGDYVSAVAANGNPVQIREAAHSDCGKPMVAVGHAGGPPVHTLEHMATGKGHAGGLVEDEGSGTPGS